MAETTHPERLTYSVIEVALALGLSKESVWQRIWDGTIPHCRVGRRVLIPRRALEALVNGPAETAGGKG